MVGYGEVLETIVASMYSALLKKKEEEMETWRRMKGFGRDKLSKNWEVGVMGKKSKSKSVELE